MRLSILFVSIVLLHISIYAQRSHIRPIHIQYCNYHKVIFIGKIKSYKKNGRITTIEFTVEEYFKSRNNRCDITLKTFDMLPEESEKLYKERWLIFGEGMDQELFFDLNESTGLDQFQRYSEELIRTDLVYLQNLAATPTRSVKEMYQSSGSGCISNDEYYIAEGELKNGFPHGRWRYYRVNGMMRRKEGSYNKGKKWGVWHEYHRNGVVAAKLIYWDDWELKRIQYDGDGVLYCFNESCTFWNPHPDITIPFLLPYEKTGFLRGIVQVE